MPKPNSPQPLPGTPSHGTQEQSTPAPYSGEDVVSIHHTDTIQILRKSAKDADHARSYFLEEMAAQLEKNPSAWYVVPTRSISEIPGTTNPRILLARAPLNDPRWDWNGRFTALVMTELGFAAFAVSGRELTAEDTLPGMMRDGDAATVVTLVRNAFVRDYQETTDRSQERNYEEVSRSTINADLVGPDDSTKIEQIFVRPMYLGNAKTVEQIREARIRSEEYQEPVIEDPDAIHMPAGLSAII